MTTREIVLFAAGIVIGILGLFLILFITGLI